MTDDQQAFPAAWGNHEQGGNYVPGMTLRDWFAGQAMPALLKLCVGDTLEKGQSYADYIARNSYEIADAMMAKQAVAEDDT